MKKTLSLLFLLITSYSYCQTIPFTAWSDGVIIQDITKSTNLNEYIINMPSNSLNKSIEIAIATRISFISIRFDSLNPFAIYATDTHGDIVTDASGTLNLKVQSSDSPYTIGLNLVENLSSRLMKIRSLPIGSSYNVYLDGSILPSIYNADVFGDVVIPLPYGQHKLVMELMIPEPTPTSTSSTTPTFTNTSVPTTTKTSTPTITKTYTPTITPTFTSSITPTFTNTIIPTNTITRTPTITGTNTPTITKTFTASATNTPTLTKTTTPTPTVTPIPTPTKNPSWSDFYYRKYLIWWKNKYVPN